MDNDICSMLNGAYQIRSAKRVINQEGNSVAMCNLSSGFDICNVRIGVTKRLNI